MATNPSEPNRGKAPGAPTLVQVAARAGVSLKTASRAINGEPRVAVGTRSRVLDSAHELGFQLNRVASMLKRGVVSNVVGLVTGDLANPFYSALSKGVEQELRTVGMQLIVASSDEEPDRERALIAELVDRQVQALVVVSTLQDHSGMRAVQDRGIPVVFVDRVGLGIEADSVVLDNKAGSRMAVEHLIAGGHSDIAFIGDLARLETHRERLDGFIQAMSAAGLDPYRWIRHDAHDAASARNATCSLLTDIRPPSALFTSNNRITIGALQMTDELGKKPALVGFDDFDLADLLHVTVMAHDPVKMGRIAAELALAATRRRESEAATHVIMPTRLVTRGSGER